MSPPPLVTPEPHAWPALRWDVFCRVIDNHGDLGVCWRLSADLAQRGHDVRLWVDDASALAWMAPHGHPGVQVHAWPDTPSAYTDCADVVVEAFGCELPLHVQATIANTAAAHTAERAIQSEPHVKWINLEYLSAEAYVPRQHGLPSPVMSGPAKGCTKWFFFPGFTSDTGGLLREPDLLAQQHHFDRLAWRNTHAPQCSQHGRLISLFCYEPAGLPDLLTQLSGTPDLLLVTPGRAWAAVRETMARHPRPQAPEVRWQALAHTDQTGFDQMLWACDLNFVRGEDSLVRALWAGQPFVWHIYPQDDGAHHHKLHAFLDWLDAPESLRRFHGVWNGLESEELPALTDHTLQTWTLAVQSAKTKLLAQAPLTEQLLSFVLN